MKNLSGLLVFAPRFLIEDNTDDQGSFEYSKKFLQERFASLYLISQEIGSSRLSTIRFGEDRRLQQIPRQPEVSKTEEWKFH